MKIYTIRRIARKVRLYSGPPVGQVEITPGIVDELGLPPVEFECGHAGMGPQQLALCILLDHTDRGVAKVSYRELTREVIAKIDIGEGESVEITAEQLDAWLVGMPLEIGVAK